MTDPRRLESEHPTFAGMRVVLDARSLQEADRAPTSAVYLGELLAAFARSPQVGESFVFLLRSDLPDPTRELTDIEVIGRRLLPPTRALRSGSLTIDPFLIGGAAVGAAWRAERGGAAGAVHHALGGAVPAFSRIPVVATLLDLAPWERPETFQRGMSARIGQRLRAGLLRDAAAVIVGSAAAATETRRLLHLRRGRIHVVPLAPRAAFRAGPGPTTGHEAGREPPAESIAEARRLGLSRRYLVYPGRFDARQDLATLLAALAELAAAGRPATLPADDPWPPRVVLVGASPDDRAAVARAAARQGVGDALAYTPALEPRRLAALVRGARAVVLPVLSEAAGLPAIEAIAAGVPVIASSAGVLPEIVGSAGILVEPRDPPRLAAAISTIVADDDAYARLAAIALDRSLAPTRTWDDVARETRAVYAAVGRARD